MTPLCLIQRVRQIVGPRPALVGNGRVGGNGVGIGVMDYSWALWQSRQTNLVSGRLSVKFWKGSNCRIILHNGPQACPIMAELVRRTLPYSVDHLSIHS